MQAKVGVPVPVPKKGKKNNKKKGNTTSSGFEIEFEIEEPQPLVVKASSSEFQFEDMFTNGSPDTNDFKPFHNKILPLSSTAQQQQQQEVDHDYESQASSSPNPTTSTNNNDDSSHSDTAQIPTITISLDHGGDTTPIAQPLEDLQGLTLEDEEEVLYPNNSKVTLEDFVLLQLVGKGAYGKVNSTTYPI
jgi:hypothetical protein